MFDLSTGMTESNLIADLKQKGKEFEDTEMYYQTHLLCPNCEEYKVEPNSDCYHCQGCGETFEVCWHCGDWNGEKSCFYCDPS